MSSAGRTTPSSASTMRAGTEASGSSSHTQTRCSAGSAGARAALPSISVGASEPSSSRYARPRWPRTVTSWLTEATRSCASSSGGRSSVLSGTSTAPTRITANATRAQSMPFGMRRPTRSPLPSPARTRRAASARLASSSSAHVIAPSSLTSAWSVGSLCRRSAITSGMVHGSGKEASLEGGSVELPAREQRDLVLAEQQEAPRHLVGREALRERRAERVEVERVARRHAQRSGHELAARGVGDADHVRGEPGEGEDRRLHLARRDVRAARLDPVPAASLEVAEAVLVDPDEVAAPVPAVGVEGLVSLAPVVALHQEGSAQVELAQHAGAARCARVGVDDASLEAGRGPAERAAPLLRLLRLVVAHQADAARLRHAEHRVAQLRVGRPHRIRQDRPEVPAPD